ncbi:MAG: hypothetical protein MRQ09_01610 [Candidatus Midichloria sp.]|nr:hypothetical protein [Candidatus Midichloria sp.]
MQDIRFAKTEPGLAQRTSETLVNITSQATGLEADTIQRKNGGIGFTVAKAATQAIYIANSNPLFLQTAISLSNYAVGGAIAAISFLTSPVLISTLAIGAGVHYQIINIIRKYEKNLKSNFIQIIIYPIIKKKRI